MKKSLIKGLVSTLAMVAVLTVAGCSADASSGPVTPGPSGSATEEKGTVSVEVTVDGTIKCGTCGKEYDLMEDAKACEHYKCDTCGIAYASEDEQAACVKHFKFTFHDSAETDANEDVVVTIPSGAKVKLPEWSKDGEEIAWDTDSDYRNDGENLDLSKPMVIADDSEDTLIEITLTASWKSTYTCSTCSKVYYTQSEVDSCTHYICANEACGKHASGYATQAEADACALKDGCPKYETECAACHKKYAHDTEAADCAETVDCPKAVTVTVTFKDSAEENAKADVTKKIFSGSSAESAAPEWKVENFTLSWTPAFAEITADTTYTANWTELPKCENCGAHYETESAVAHCSKQEGCPYYGKLVTITFSGTKAASANCDNPAIKVELSSGNISTNKYTYNNKEYTPILKLESATSIKLTGVAGKTITLVTTGTATDKGVYVLEDGAESKERVKGSANGIITYTATKNIVTITKDDSRNCAVIFIE